MKKTLDSLNGSNSSSDSLMCSNYYSEELRMQFQIASATGRLMRFHRNYFSVFLVNFFQRVAELFSGGNILFSLIISFFTAFNINLDFRLGDVKIHNAAITLINIWRRPSVIILNFKGGPLINSKDSYYHLGMHFCVSDDRQKQMSAALITAPIGFDRSFCFSTYKSFDLPCFVKLSLIIIFLFLKAIRK